MKILFYLPVITPWWFDHVIAPMLRALDGDPEVTEQHVMIAPLWRNTGIDGHQLAPLADLGKVHWHVIDQGEPEEFRTNGAGLEGLLDLVDEIEPDLCLVRSADFETPAQFPGIVRHIMEGAAAPFETGSNWFVLEEHPFRFGIFPEAAEPTARSCQVALSEIWEAMDERQVLEDGASDWRKLLGLPGDRPIISVPLHYEHEENFFGVHASFARGTDLLSYLLETLADDAFLAVTDHPLNRLYTNRTAIDALISGNADRACLCVAEKLPHDATGLLSAKADAVLSDLSKSWSMAAYCGTPIVHVGRNAMAEWIHATNGVDRINGKLAARGLPGADPSAAREWFSWHLAARLMVPKDVTAGALMRQVDGIVTDEQIEEAAGRIKTWFDGARWT
ncbi:MAG: hypothetical protein H6917_00400 [Novosphingobium sp.]|nr:hypothetical protein [Novosphingobium sp.]MCP5400827.1 hypothetical protein [Novosphingobium sp.]